MEQWIGRNSLPTDQEPEGICRLRTLNDINGLCQARKRPECGIRNAEVGRLKMEILDLIPFRKGEDKIV